MQAHETCPDVFYVWSRFDLFYYQVPICYILAHYFSRSVKNWIYFRQLWGNFGLVVVECLPHFNLQSSSQPFFLEGVLQI